MTDARAARRTVYEQLDAHHARVRTEAYWTPEAVESRRLEHAEIAAGIVRKTPCGDCGAATGQPCAGLVDAVHLGRHTRYARTGWLIPC